jgi:hypothetical protein
MRLLVYADHDGVLRRGQVQAHDVANLRVQLRSEENLNPSVRLQAEPVPHPDRTVVADRQLAGGAQPVRQPPRRGRPES